MNAKQAEAWIHAKDWLETHSDAPAVLVREATKKAGAAVRKAKPFKPPIRLPKGGKKKVSIPKLKKELDRVFSIFIRTRDANENGMGFCKTCGRHGHWRDMDAGHYVPRQDLATRWDERNVHLQCKKCNGFRGGEPELMHVWIDNKYGPGTAVSLMVRSKQPYKLQRHWLEEKIAQYKKSIGEVA